MCQCISALSVSLTPCQRWICVFSNFFDANHVAKLAMAPKYTFDAHLKLGTLAWYFDFAAIFCYCVLHDNEIHASWFGRTPTWGPTSDLAATSCTTHSSLSIRRLSNKNEYHFNCVRVLDSWSELDFEPLTSCLSFSYVYIEMLNSTLPTLPLSLCDTILQFSCVYESMM